MPVLTPVPVDLSSSSEAAPPEPIGPSCTLQRSGSLWQLGIEAQELTTAIGQLAEKLEADDDTRAQASLSWRLPCWLRRATNRPSPPRQMPPAG